MDAVLRDDPAADITPELRAMLVFVRKLTRTPEAVTPDDARAVLDAGVSEQAFIEALNVQAMFAFITRCADTFNFEIGPDAAFAASAKGLLKFGYKL